MIVVLKKFEKVSENIVGRVFSDNTVGCAVNKSGKSLPKTMVVSFLSKVSSC